MVLAHEACSMCQSISWSQVVVFLLLLETFGDFHVLLLLFIILWFLNERKLQVQSLSISGQHNLEIGYFSNPVPETLLAVCIAPFISSFVSLLHHNRSNLLKFLWNFVLKHELYSLSFFFFFYLMCTHIVHIYF